MEQKIKRNNVTMKVKLTDQCVTLKGAKYNRESLLASLTSGFFSKISIPLYSYRNLILDTDKPGNTVVGYITGFDAVTELFDITVYETSVEKVAAFEQAIIFPRVTIDYDTSDVKLILGLDICPGTYHQ